MNINKFTQKSIEAVNQCEKIAYDYGNQEIDQEHFLYSINAFLAIHIRSCFLFPRCFLQSLVSDRTKKAYLHKIEDYLHK